MSIEGVEYAGTRPDPKCLAANGYSFAARYLEPANDWKTLTRAEADALHAAGVAVVGLFELQEGRPLAGFTAGAADAAGVMAHKADVGMPVDRPVYFAVDFDATSAQLAGPITAYFQGVASVMPLAQVGGYGGYRTVQYLFDHGLIRWGYQTFAWSRGSDGKIMWDARAHMQQYTGQVPLCGTVDDITLNRGMVADVGQWPAPEEPSMTRTLSAAGLTFQIHTRADWQTVAQPVTGPAPYPDKVHTVVVHYPGNADTWVPDTDVAAHLRRGQASYLANKGFSYGYSFVIGPNPVDWDAKSPVLDVWEVRGVDIRNAANNGDRPPWSDYSNPNWNGYTTSIQFMCSTAHPPTPDQQLSFRYLLAWLDGFYGETLTVQGHRVSDSTECPGDAVMAMIPALSVRPATHPPEPTPPEEDDMPKPGIARSSTNTYSLRTGIPGVGAYALRSNEYALLKADLDAGTTVPFVNPIDGTPITAFESSKPGGIPTLDETHLDLYVGYLTYDSSAGGSKPDEG